MRFRLLGLATILLAALGAVSCANLVDRDNIRVAKIDGEYITRGDVYEHIRSFPEMMRPRINNAGDMLNLLNKMVDDRIKRNYLEAQREEVGADQIDAAIQAYTPAAREVLFGRLGAQAEQLRAVYNMEVPANDEPTELMKVYGLTAESLRSTHEFIDEQARIIAEELIADQIIGLMAANALQAGEIQIDEEALKIEYNFQKADLVKPETVTFTAIRNMAEAPNAQEDAQATRDRIGGGDDFDTVVAEMQEKYPGAVVQNTLPRSETSDRFQAFWQAVDGKEPGEIVGPVLMPSYEQVRADASGQQRPVTVPATYMVLRIDARQSAGTMTLEEARPQLAPPLVIAAMMKKLREDHGVEIYEDKLPDAGQFGGATNVKPMA